MKRQGRRLKPQYSTAANAYRLRHYFGRYTIVDSAFSTKCYRLTF